MPKERPQLFTELTGVGQPHIFPQVPQTRKEKGQDITVYLNQHRIFPVYMDVGGNRLAESVLRTSPPEEANAASPETGNLIPVVVGLMYELGKITGEEYLVAMFQLAHLAEINPQYYFYQLHANGDVNLPDKVLPQFQQVGRRFAQVENLTKKIMTDANRLGVMLMSAMMSSGFFRTSGLSVTSIKSLNEALSQISILEPKRTSTTAKK